MDGSKLTQCLVLLFSVSVAVCNAQTPHELLWNGAPNGAVQALEMMKKDPTWIHKRDGDSRTPLHIAARFAHPDVVQWLLDNGADVNAKAYNNFTPLHLTEDPAIVRLILTKQPNFTVCASGESSVHKVIGKLRHMASLLGGSPDLANQVEALQRVVEIYVEYAGDNLDLISAIRLGKLGRVKSILGETPARAHGGNSFRTPLREAVDWGQLAICKYLIEQHRVDVDDFQGGSGYPVIKSALKYPDVVELLIESGADLNTRITWKGIRTGRWIIGDNATLLHFAVAYGHRDSVTHLVDGGVLLLANTTDSFSRSAKEQTELDVGAFFGRADTTEALLSHPEFAKRLAGSAEILDRALIKAIHASTAFRLTPGTESGGSSDVVRLLIGHGADPNATLEGRDLLQVAAAHVHPSSSDANKDLRTIANLLREMGLAMDLYCAVAFSDIDEAGRLLGLDAVDRDARRSDGYPALHLAIAMNQFDMVELMLDHGCSVDIRNESDRNGTQGDGVLHCSVFWGHLEMTKLLVARGANVDAVNSRGETPLHDAASLSKAAQVKLLLNEDASRDMLNREDKTARELAKRPEVQSLFD